MADLKISALPASTVPLAGTEVLPIVQNSATKQVTVANLTAGRAVATGALTVTGDATLSTGNLVPATAAKGINFTANTPAAGMTSQLLNWYEEGAWTPTIVSAGGAVTYNTQSGSYTRIGNLVTFNLYISFNAATASGALSIGFDTLPAQKTGTTASNWPVLFTRGFVFPANKTALYIYKNTGSANAALTWQDITGAAGTATDASIITAAFGTAQIMVSGSYLTN
jgi:hypothetical protein